MSESRIVTAHGIFNMNVEMDELDTRITNAQKDKLSAGDICSK